jgi:hypothetical protein
MATNRTHGLGPSEKAGLFVERQNVAVNDRRR